MFSDIHYIAPCPDTTVPPPGLLQKGVFRSYIFDVDNPDQNDTLFKLVFSGTQPLTFSITLRLSEEVPVAALNELWFERLSIIMCHPHYIGYGGKSLLGFLYTGTTPETDQSRFIGLLDTLLLTQGISILPLSNIQGTTENGNIVILTNLNWIEEITDESFYYYYIQLIAKGNLPVHFFFFSYTPHLIMKLAALKDKAENMLAEKDPQLSELLRKHRNKLLELEKTERNYANLKESFGSLQQNHNLLLGSFDSAGSLEPPAMSDVMKIKKFYYNEYEILPRWYKQVGHVIKVVMGKRTFRSLFNKNVKKYKE